MKHEPDAAALLRAIAACEFPAVKMDRPGPLAREAAAIRASREEVYSLLVQLRRPLRWRPEYATPEGVAALRRAAEARQCKASGREAVA